MKKPFKKIVAGILAAVLALSMPFTGVTKTERVYAADNKALAAPINFLGLNDEEGTWWNLCQTTLDFDVANVDAFSTNYTYSYKMFIPKAAVSENNAVVFVSSWFNLNMDEGYHGGVDSRYVYRIVNENNEIFPVVVDQQEGKPLEASEYEKFFKMEEVDDFYMLTITDAPARDVRSWTGQEGERDVPIDTTKKGNINMRTQVTACNSKLSSIMYLDDLTVKAGDTVLWQTDFSAASMYEHNYDYVVGEDKDENRVDRPATVELDTNLVGLPQTSASIKAGETVSINATAAGGAQITYKSSNEKVATVTAEGVVTGAGAGTAEIAVSANGIAKTFTATVSAAQNTDPNTNQNTKKTLKLAKSSVAIKVGKTVKINATATGGGTITYKSSNKKVATVTKKGVVKGVKAGKATITVSANGISKKFKVTVKK